METSSETSSVTSPAPSSPVPINLRRSLSASDLHIEEAMRNLVLNTNLQDVATQRSNNELYRAKSLRHKLKILGKVDPPSKGAPQDALEIYKAIKNPPSPGKMSDGKIYVYKHTSISGIFKIGWTSKSALIRQRQTGNCYGIDTEPIYETDKPFAGAYQAERIIHAVLKHKQLRIYNCSKCGSGHKEWFLTSREEALKIVKCAESWLQMPAYTIHQGKVKLLPEAEVIYTSMFGFSLSGLSQHINNNIAPDDASDALSVTQLAAAIQEIRTPTSSSSITRNRSHTRQASKTSTSTPSIRPGEQISAIRRAASALQEMDSDTFNELTRPRSLRSTHLDSDEDYSDEDYSDDDSGEDYSEVESEKLDHDEEDIEDKESKEFNYATEHVEDEESSEAEEPYIDDDYNQDRGFRVRTRSQSAKATADLKMDVVEVLKAIRRGGAVEFRVIFPSQDL